VHGAARVRVLFCALRPPPQTAVSISDGTLRGEVTWVPAFAGMTGVVKRVPHNWRHSRGGGSPVHGAAGWVCFARCALPQPAISNCERTFASR
jgi:hypothetical protein